MNENEEVIDNSGTVFYFYVKDKAGVVKKDVTITSEMFNPMKISSLNPTITGTDGWTNNGTIEVTFTRIPNVTYQYTTDGGTGWNTLTGSSFSVTSEGDYTNKIKVKATYKNETRELATPVSYKYDKTPPTVSTTAETADDMILVWEDNISGLDKSSFTTEASNGTTDFYGADANNRTTGSYKFSGEKKWIR